MKEMPVSPDVLDCLTLGVFRLKPGIRERFLFVNPAFAAMVGYPSEELLAMEAKALFVEKRRLRAAYQRVDRQGRCEVEEIGLRTRSGQVLTCSLSLVAVQNARGRLQFIDGIINNMTPQRLAARGQQEAKELFSTVFNNSAALILVLDEAQRLVSWNPFAEQLLGMEKIDLFNKPVAELFLPREAERLARQKVWSQPMVSEVETQIQKRDGGVLDINMSVSGVRDADDRVIGSVAIMLDVTRQKLAERRIRESENKIRIILDNSAAAITLTDEQERIVSWNKFTEQLLEKSREELYLQPVASLYPPEEWEMIRAANIRAEGSKHHLETRIVRKDGQLIDVDLSVNILKDSQGQLIGSVGIMQDITEKKRVWQELLTAKIIAEEANSAKSLFLANMSHEVRTPMNTIIGMIDLTLDTELNEEQRDNLTTVKNAADILLSLLNDILDLSRVEAGKIQLENIELSVPNIVKSVCKGLSVLACKKNIDLVWSVPAEVPEVLIGDPVRIRQVLVNLINNAIKFTFKGKITTTVQVNAVDGETCELQFAVADEGIGIPPDKLDNIFEVFTQADASTTRRFGGTGLGLSISSKLVEMMGGRIWVESEEFKGSTFYFTSRFTIGQKIAPAPEAPVREDAAALEAPRLPRTLRVLLAEDNIVNQKITLRMLEKRGWVAKAAENGKQVLEYLDTEKFDVILMDAQMPVLDGYETTRLIRQREQETGGHIPIIALTARAMAGDRKKCLDCGMDSYVAKPIDRQKMYETIEGFF